MNRRAAFTLIELSVIIVLIALAAAIAYPRLNALIGAQNISSFRHDAERLARQARERAILDSRTVVLRWDDGLVAEFESTEEENQDEAQEVGRVRAPEGVEFDRATLKNGEVSEEEWTVRLFSEGNSEDGAVIWTANNRIQNLQIFARDGRALAQNGEPVEVEQPWEAGPLEERLQPN